MSALRSAGWVVEPSFVPHGATYPVTLLVDDDGLTQLAGEPPVAWQTPWSEVTSPELVRTGRAVTLSAAVGDRRFTWRRRGVDGFDDLATVVRARGGVVRRARPRGGVVLVAAIVFVASITAGVVAWLSHRGPSELARVRQANLALSDLPPGWYSSSEGVLSYLVPPASGVYTSTTNPSTTTTSARAPLAAAATIFQRCLGVSARSDRVYGAAGQQPDVQTSSPIFESNLGGGGEVASVAQYYRTTAMVRADTAEMSRAAFGRCFVDSQAALLLGEEGRTPAAPPGAVSWRPRTFLTGWSAGGYVRLDVPLLTVHLDLVVAIVTHGHYEVTLDALVPSFNGSRGLLDRIVATLDARVSSTSARAA